MAYSFFIAMSLSFINDWLTGFGHVWLKYCQGIESVKVRQGCEAYTLIECLPNRRPRPGCLRKMILYIFIYLFYWWFISWESRPNLAFRKIKWTEHSGFVLQEPELYYISGKLLSFWTIHFQCQVRTVLGGSKPMRFHGPIMDTIIPKIGSNLTFESLWSISICFVRDWPVN